MATRELSLSTLIKVSRYRYVQTSLGVWRDQIYSNLVCDNIRMGIALGRFTAPQAIYFDWEIRKFLNDLEVVNHTRPDSSQLALIIELSENIRTGLEKNTAIEMGNDPIRLLLRLESKKIAEEYKSEYGFTK